jgi:hypothetical protein
VEEEDTEEEEGWVQVEEVAGMLPSSRARGSIRLLRHLGPFLSPPSPLRLPFAAHWLTICCLRLPDGVA